MKLTFAALAAVGVVHADIAATHEHNPKVPIVDLIYKPLFGEHIKRNCPEGIHNQLYPDGMYVRKAMQAMHFAGLNSLFGEDANQLQNEVCFGDWMHETAIPVYDIVDKIHNDMWSV